MVKAKKTVKKNNDEPIEKQLWKVADKLRKNIDAAEYKHIVLGLMFLKYISDAFEELHSKLLKGEGDLAHADPEDKEEYKAENVFFVPPSARWNFLKTHAPASLWFLNRNKPVRREEILFIDARNEGHLINRRTRELSEEDIQKITNTYHNWRNAKGKYEDIKGFCNSTSIERVKELDYVLTPGRYVGLPDEEDDFDFNERFTALKKEFEGQLKEEEKLNARIKENLKKVKINGKS